MAALAAKSKMEASTKRRVLLGIGKVKGEAGLFSFKALGLSLGLSKARISVLLSEMFASGDCLRLSGRDGALSEKGEAELSFLRGLEERLQTRLEGIFGKDAKALSQLIVVNADEKLLGKLG